MRQFAHRRVNKGPPPKPEFLNNQTEIKPTVDLGIDEADRKKFEQLAEPFLKEPVSELPTILEREINNNYSQNAQSLVQNKQDLKEATDMLEQIQGKLVISLEQAQETLDREQEVSKQLSRIGLNNDKDAHVIMNKKLAHELLQKIYQDATIPENDVNLLTNPRFTKAQEIEQVFELLLKLTKEIEKGDTPQSLIGLHAADERIQLYQEKLDKFADHLVSNQFEKKLANVQIIVVEANSLPNVEFIPPEIDELFNDGEKPKETPAASPLLTPEIVTPPPPPKDGDKSDDDDDDNSDKSDDDDGNIKLKPRRHKGKHSRHKSKRHSRRSSESDSAANTNGDTRKKFSIPGVSRHPLLKWINGYWKFVRWLQKYHYHCYEKLQKAYIGCASSYLKDPVGTNFKSKVESMVEYKRPNPVSTDPFSTDEDYLSSPCKSFAEKIQFTFNEFFLNLRNEGCILTEFWKLTDSELLSKLIPHEFLQYVENMMTSIQNFDPLYYIIPYTICSHEEQRSIIPIDSITAIARENWNNYIEEQLTAMNNAKIPKKQENVLKVFQDLPNFIKALVTIAPAKGKSIVEQTILHILEQMLVYLQEKVIPKGTKKSKGARIIIINLVHLCESLDNVDFITNSEILNEKMKNVKSLLEENIDTFLNLMAQKAWPEPYAFFHQIDEWMKQEGFTYEIVTFQISHTTDKFRELNEKIDKKIQISVNECHAFLKKKIKLDNLRNKLKQPVLKSVGNIFQRWSDLAEKCYDLKLITTPEKVNQLLLNHA